MNSSKKRVEVFIRIKPTDKFNGEVLDIQPDHKTLVIHAIEEKRKAYINNQILDWKFALDGILHNASQETVFHSCATKLISQTLDGYNCTLFAYGQTGGGKTYTMTGTTNNFQHRGIIPRAISQMYKEMKQRDEHEITIRISYLEIYKEEMYDLLETMDHAEKHDYSSSMTISENQTGAAYVKGLSCRIAKTEEDALALLFEGESNRIISHHQLNRNSSRSHCIFTVHVESHSITESDIKYTVSKLNLVDLAGSERIGKTLSTGATQEEALYINKSLTFLEQTVIALEDNSRYHIPYRQSKLTHVLKDSLGGNCSTVMIGNIWGQVDHIEETLSTLRFASRAMNIQSSPTVNSFDDPKLLCIKYEKEILTLRKELAMYDMLSNRSQVNYEPLSALQINEIKMQMQKFIDDESDEIEIVNLRQIHEIFGQFKKMLLKTENDVMTKIKERNVIHEKNEVAEKPFENISPTIERGGTLVGETDGNGFNVGRASLGVKPAASSAVANVRKRNKKGRDLQDNDRKTPPSSTIFPNPSNATQMDQKTGDEVTSGINLDTNLTTIPPQKNEGYEIFKSDHGKELNQIFQENKDILRNKKIEAKQVSISVNEVKRSIDDVKFKLEVYQQNNEYGLNTDDTEYIYEQGEFDLAQKLRQLKSEYRCSYELLQSLNSDILYCEKLVKQCRQTLLTEFECWYDSTFDHGFTNKISRKISVGKQQAEVKSDNGELFEKVQKELLLKQPESYAFYNARLQTDRRRLYNNNSDKRRMNPTLPKLNNASSPLPILLS